MNIKPNLWEDRTALSIAFLVDEGMQSSLVRSYISTIKRIIIDDGYPWKDNKMLLASLTKACKITNDRVRTRLPIGFGLLELILFEIQRHYLSPKSNQTYLTILYQAMFAIGYYGLLRVGEMTFRQHTIKAKDIHLGTTKDKIKLILYTSKTHGRGTVPQEVKIVSNSSEIGAKGNQYNMQRNFCPFNLMQKYFKIQKIWERIDEPCFIFQDGSPVTPVQVRQLLRLMLKKLGLNEVLYDMHSLRIG